MSSLTEVYEANAREVTNLRRLYAGTGLLVAGAVLSLVALVLATTDLFGGVVTTIGDPYGTIAAATGDGIGHITSLRVAGVLAGLSVPAALVGVFLVLPAGRWVKAAGAISTSLCLLGVTLFWYAYPLHWRGFGDDLTLQVAAIYLLGLFIAIWCLFTAVVNFKTRNDPGGMLEMRVTRTNQTILEVDEDEDGPGLGGVGLFGADPDGEVETQTNAPGTTVDTDDSVVTRSGRSTQTAPPVGAGAPTSDGGAAATDLSSPLDDGDTGAEVVRNQPDTPAEPADTYCGNCRHFEYVRDGNGIVPYCGFHEEAMTDMDACDEWTPNRR